MPPDPRMVRLFDRVNLGAGLVAGAGLVVVGLTSTVWALSDRGAESFGALGPRETLRLVIPVVTALALGFQTMLSSFFLSVLGMSRRR